MNLEEVMEQLKKLGNEKRKLMYINNGATENTFGTLMGDLRKLGKVLGKNQELAKALWNTGNTDAQWLSTLVFKPKELSKEEIIQMVSSLHYRDMIDKVIGQVVRFSSFARELEKEWRDSPEDNLGRAGWNLAVYRIGEGKTSPEELTDILHIIEKELKETSPGKQWAMNHALCQIGITYTDYTKIATDLGEKLGVYKEMKVSKGCTSAYAPMWIAAGVKKK